LVTVSKYAGPPILLVSLVPILGENGDQKSN